MQIKDLPVAVILGWAAQHCKWHQLLHSEAKAGTSEGQAQHFHYFTGLWDQYFKPSHKSVIFLDWQQETQS